MTVQRWICSCVLIALGVWLLTGGGCERSDRENVLVVYSAGPRALAEAICQQFTAETGVRIELFTATSGQVMAKLKAERFNPRADVVILASAFSAEWLKRENLLRPYHPDADGWIARSHQHWHDPDNTYFATSVASIGIATRDSHEHNEIGWDDFFSGRFPGAAVMPSPSRSGSSSDFVLSFILSQEDRDSAFEGFVRARGAGLQIAGANNQALTSLLIGSHDAVLGAVDYLVYREIARGEPLAMHFPPTGVVIVPRPIAILRSTKRSDLAEQFLDHCFSLDSQTRIAEMHLLPARTDVSPSDVRQDVSHLKTIEVDMDEVLVQQRQILRRFQYEVERAVMPTGSRP